MIERHNYITVVVLEDVPFHHALLCIATKWTYSNLFNHLVRSEHANTL